MMKKISRFCVLLFLIPVFVQARKMNPTGRKPSQAKTSPMYFKIVHGDRETMFTMTSDGNGARVELLNTIGKKGSKEIAKSDYDYLRTEFAELPGDSNRIDFCSRSYMQITQDKIQKTGCLGSSTKIAQKMQNIFNLLSLLF